jgi:hypothetical protein
VSETVDVALNTVEAMQVQYKEFSKKAVIRRGNTLDCGPISNKMQFQHGVLKALSKRNESNATRIQNEIQLVSFTTRPTDLGKVL